MLTLSKKIIEEASSELESDPSFIEKDWYISDVLKLFLELKNEDRFFIFSGGTSLSKGHRKIQRFSEDIDMRISSTKEIDRKERRNIRNEVLEVFRKHPLFTVQEKSIEIHNESKQISFLISYPKLYENAALRNDIKIELNFEKLTLNPEEKYIQSLIHKLAKNDEFISIPCISLVETAVNKLSALAWRVKNIKTQEPEIMRHLHDLSALESDVLGYKNFSNLLKEVWEIDKNRGLQEKDLQLKESLDHLYSEFSNNLKYKKDYDEFVSSMYYGKKQDRISFEQAMKSLKKIIEIIY